MTKKFIIAAVIIVVAIVGLAIYVSMQNNFDVKVDKGSNYGDMIDFQNDNSDISGYIATTTQSTTSTDSGSAQSSEELDLDKDIAELDAAIKADSMSDLDDSNLSDSQLGL